MNKLFTRGKQINTSHLQNPELNQIELLIGEEKFENALQDVEKFEKKDDLSENNRIKNQVLKSLILTKMGVYETALEIAQRSIDESQHLDNPLLELDSSLSLANALFEHGKLNECLDVIIDGEILLKEIKSVEKLERTKKEAALNLLKGKIYRKKSDFKLAHENLQKCLAISKDIGNSFLLTDALNNIGIIYASKGEFDLALNFFSQSLEMNEALGSKQPKIKLLNNFGMIYWQKGELDLAYEYYNQCLNLSREFKDKKISAGVLLNIGIICLDKGDIHKALDHFQNSLMLYEELESNYEIALCLNNIGNVYQIKEDLDQALLFYIKSLAIFEELEDKKDIAHGLNNIGDIYKIEGNYEKALVNYKKCLNLYEEIGNNQDTSLAIYNLVSVCIESDLIDEAESYLDKFKIMAEQESNKQIDQLYRLSKALVLKTYERIVKKVEAQQLFQQIAEEEVIQLQYTVSAMLNLSDLLLFELKASGVEDVVYEVKTLFNKLITIAENQNSFSILIETYLLQSKMALIELNVNEAQDLLVKAENITRDNELHRLLEKVLLEQDTLETEVEKWNELAKQSASLFDRLEQANLLNYIKKAKKITQSHL
jgi:tetratricopeptide (TPR) repeat protein